MVMNGEPTLPAGSRRARVALLVAGAVVLVAAVGAALGAAGNHDRQPGAEAGVDAAGTTVASQEAGVTVAGGGSGGQGGSGGGASSGGGSGGGGTSRTTTGRATTTSSPATTEAPTTTAPRVELIGGSGGKPTKECDQQPDGRWHFRVQFNVVLTARGAGTVRYQWGRGGGDVRSDVRTFNIDEKFANETVQFAVSDVMSGSAPSPTDEVIDRLYILEPPNPALNGRPWRGDIVKICP